MLHGWAQNEMVFRNRTKSLTKKLNEAGFEYCFLRAPVRLPPLKVSEAAPKPGRDNARAWFLYNTQDPSDRSMSQTGQTMN